MTLPTRQRFHENTTGDPRFSFLEVGDQLEAFSNNDQRKQSEQKCESSFFTPIFQIIPLYFIYFVLVGVPPLNLTKIPQNKAIFEAGHTFSNHFGYPAVSFRGVVRVF